MPSDRPLFLRRAAPVPDPEIEDFAVIDAKGAVVGRIVSQHWTPPSGLRWFWSITAPGPVIGNTHGRAAGRAEAMAAFKARWIEFERARLAVDGRG